MTRNKFELTGRISQQPELKKVKVGDTEKSVLRLSLAVDKGYLDPNGERQVDFMDITFWDKLADTIAEHKNKGDLVKVEGEVVPQKFELKGDKVGYGYVLRGNEIDFLANAHQKQDNTLDPEKKTNNGSSLSQE